MHEHKTNSDSSISALDTRDSKQCIQAKSATDNRDKADIKTIPQPQGDIRCEHKTNSDTSERQYIAKVRETVFTSHCTFEFETTRMGESLIDLVHQYLALWDKQNSKYKL